MSPPFTTIIPQTTALTEAGVVDDPWIQDPYMENGCVATADGWGCNNGVTQVGGELIIAPQAGNANVDTRLTGGAGEGYNDPPAGNITLYFTLRQITAGSGLRLRTQGSVLRGQYGVGQNQHTYPVDGGVQTIQWEVIPGFGEWAMSWCSTVQPGP